MNVPVAQPGASWRSRFQAFAASLSLVSARSAILATLGLGLCFSIRTAFRVLAESRNSGTTGLILPICLLAFAAVGFAGYLARRRQPLSPRWFIPIAFFVALAIRLVYYFTIDPVWVSDFKTYWQVANVLADADHYHVVSIYQQRALPYLTPLVELFGSSPDVVKLANIAVLSLVQLLGYDVVRRCHGHPAAQCFTVLWLAAPEPLYSSLIPSHDLVATAQIAIVVWLATLAVVRGPGKKTRANLGLLLLTPPIAIMLVALELQRGIGLILLATLVAVGIAGVAISSRFRSLFGSDSREPRRLLLLAVLSLPLYALVMQAIVKADLTIKPAAATAGMLRYTTAHVTSLSDGSYKWMVAFHDTFSSVYAKDNDRLADLRQSLALSDFEDGPAHRAENAIKRMEKLYFLGGSFPFYVAGGDRSDLPDVIQSLRLYDSAFALWFAGLTLVGLLRLMTRPRFPLMAGVLMVLIAAVTLSLALMAENQPRYLYMIWFVGAATAAFGTARPRPLINDSIVIGGFIAWRSALWVVAQSFVFVALAWTVAWLALASFYDAGTGRIISGWRLSLHQPSEPAPAPDWANSLLNAESDVLRARHGKHKRPLPKRFGNLALMLQFPGIPRVDDRVDAQRRVCARGDRDDISFFVYMPYKNMKRKGAFELQVSVDGDVKWKMPLPHAVRPEAIDIKDAMKPGTCAMVTFTLLSHVSHSSDSWRRASRVEVFFPRLVQIPSEVEAQAH
jgi:hypothetical protein